MSMTTPLAMSTRCSLALARDHATRVRAAIAHEIKAMIAAPHDLVLLLARDAAIEVSDPIVRLSPVLTDADLLALLATPPHPSAAELIASRPRVGAAVADAIAKHADAPAVRALLANPSACIKEATLDALVGRAAHHLEWHVPLVYRPYLSVKAVRALSQFVATDLLRIFSRPESNSTRPSWTRSANASPRAVPTAMTISLRPKARS